MEDSEKSDLQLMRELYRTVIQDASEKTADRIKAAQELAKVNEPEPGGEVGEPNDPLDEIELC